MVSKKEKKGLELDYKKLFPDFELTNSDMQWKKEGDKIPIFTLFEDYPPSYSTCHTILNET